MKEVRDFEMTMTANCVRSEAKAHLCSLTLDFDTFGLAKPGKRHAVTERDSWLLPASGDIIKFDTARCAAR